MFSRDIVHHRRQSFKRTLADAFPDERAIAIEHHRAARSLIRPVLLFGAALLVGAGGFLYLIGG